MFAEQLRGVAVVIDAAVEGGEKRENADDLPQQTGSGPQNRTKAKDHEEGDVEPVHGRLRGSGRGKRPWRIGPDARSAHYRRNRRQKQPLSSATAPIPLFAGIGSGFA